MTTIISATKLKSKISEVLNSVHYNKNIAIVERHGKPIAKIIPIDEGVKKNDLKLALDRTFGSIPDFPDVTKFRRSRKRRWSL